MSLLSSSKLLFLHEREKEREERVVPGCYDDNLLCSPLTPHLLFHFFVHLFTCDDDDTTAREANTEFEVDRTCRP
jgi:hypothetical protein